MNDVLVDAIPPQFPRSLVSIEGSSSGEDLFDTDLGLFSLIVVNAVNNACEAIVAGPQGSGIVMQSEVGDGHFLVTITNSFVGGPFELSDVVATGFTTKPDNRGIGTQVMKLAAERLGYAISLEGSGGVATFKLTGSTKGHG